MERNWDSELSKYLSAKLKRSSVFKDISDGWLGPRRPVAKEIIKEPLVIVR